MMASHPLRTNTLVSCCHTRGGPVRHPGGQTLGRGSRPVGIALGHAAEELHGLGLEPVGHTRTGQALGGHLGGQIKPHRQIGFTHQIGLWRKPSLRHALQN
jgi:hypothetical protein